MQTLKSRKPLRSIKDELLEIVEQLDDPDDPLASENPLFKEAETGYRLVKAEINSLAVPIDIAAVTERCEDLERLHKVVAVQLAFNVTRHSDGFVEGMTNINGLQVDLDEARTIAAHSRASVEFLRRTIVLSTQKALALRLKRARLAGVRRVLKDVVLKFVERERTVRARGST